MPLFNDNFIRDDAPTDLGANYTDCLDAGLGVLSNACYNDAGDVSRGSFLTAVTQAADQYAEVTIRNPGANRYFTLLLRGAGADGTRDVYQISVGGTDELYITRIEDGANTSQATGNFTLTDGMRLRAEAEDTTIRLLLDATERLTKIDSAHASGFTGLEIFRSNVTTCSMEDFQAGDLDAVVRREPLLLLGVS